MKKLPLLIIITLITIARPLSAESTGNMNPQTTANEIYYQVLSPFCPGRALADCPSTKAHELKLEILQELESGKSKAEVLDIVFKKYGDEFNSKPPLSGFASLAWIIPILFFTILGLIFYLKIKKETESGENQDLQSSDR